MAFMSRTRNTIRGIIDLSKPAAPVPPLGQTGPTAPAPTPPPAPSPSPAPPTGGALAVRGTFGSPSIAPTADFQPAPQVKPPISSGFQAFQNLAAPQPTTLVQRTADPVPVAGPVEPPTVVRAPDPAPVAGAVEPPKPAPVVVRPPIAEPVAGPVEPPKTEPAVVRKADPAPDSGPTPQPATPTPQEDLTEVREFLKTLMTQKDDPVLRRQWNQLLVSRGLENQAAMDALKMRINQDPALRGQPAGDTLMMELIRDSGFSLDQARATLSLESANRILELNQYGAEKFLDLAKYRITRQDAQRSELLSAGDFAGYARVFKEQTGLDIDISQMKDLSPGTTKAVDALSKAMVRNIESGNMDAARRNFESIKALAPTLYGQMSFEDAVSKKDAFVLQSEARQEVGALVRTQVSQGDITGALAGIEQLMPDRAARVRAGGQLAAATDLATLNKALKAAGMSEVTDKSELIGREDDVWKATQLAGMLAASGKTVVDETVGMLQKELQQLGFNPTDPAQARALRSYALNLQLTGGLKVGPDGKVSLDENSVIPPWDPKSVDSHIFTDWPVMDAAGKASSGWDPYGESNPRPAPDTALGKYYEDLDGKWEDYLLKTPAATRLTREQWFYATQAGTAAVDPAKVPGGIAPEKPDVTDPLAADAVFQKVRLGQTLLPAEIEALKASGRLSTFSIKDLAAQKASTLANNETAGLVLLDGHLVQVLPTQGTWVDGSKWVQVKVGGKEYKVDDQGRWYASDAKETKSKISEGFGPFQSTGTKTSMPTPIKSPFLTGAAAVPEEWENNIANMPEWIIARLPPVMQAEVRKRKAAARGGAV